MKAVKDYGKVVGDFFQKWFYIVAAGLLFGAGWLVVAALILFDKITGSVHLLNFRNFIVENFCKGRILLLKGM